MWRFLNWLFFLPEPNEINDGNGYDNPDIIYLDLDSGDEQED